MAKTTEKHRREQLARIQRAIDEFYYNTYGFGELGIACEKAFEALIEKERETREAERHNLQACDTCPQGAHWDGVVICDRDGQRHERTDGCERG